jgi:hypothetical protein
MMTWLTNMGQNRKQLTREKLYEEIWTEPMTVAKAKADWLNPMNDISDLLLDAPIPARQYWWQ